MLIIAALIIVLIVFTVVQARLYLRTRRLRRMSWDDLVARLQPVNVKGVEEIAENFLHPSKSQRRLEPPVMWEVVGKWKGFDALKANANTMLDLAAFASRWDEAEGRVVAALIRRDGVRLKRAVLKIELMVLSRSFRRVRAPINFRKLRQRIT